MKTIESVIERILWTSRLVVIVPVVFSLLVAIALFYATTLDAVSLISRMIGYGALTDSERSVQRVQYIIELVSMIDNYLLAALLILFALGLYELYINKISTIENSEFAGRLLLIKSFDDLKDRLASVVLLILVVKFFQQALSLKYTSVTDLLLLSAGVALVGIALFLTKKPAAKGDKY